MNDTLLREELERHEGKRSVVYLDSLGYKTAGIGHLLIDCDLPVGTPVSDRQITEWFNSDIQDAIVITKKYITNFTSLDEVRQRVCVNLAFNLGNRLKKFPKFLAAINSNNFEEAADQLKNSAWYGQVGNRGIELVAAMRSGVI